MNMHWKGGKLGAGVILLSVIATLGTVVDGAPAAADSLEAADASAPGAPKPGSGPLDYRGPVRVIEADTFEIYPNGRQTGVGVIGIKAPPGNTDCGRQAIQFVQQQLVRGGLFLAEDTAIGFDARKRRMYYAIARDNRKLDVELVKNGFARSTNEGKEKDELGRVEDDAKKNQKGCVHGNAGLAPSPADIPLDHAEDVTADMPRAKSARPLAATLGSGFQQQVVATGFTNPTAFAFLPDGRVLVAEKRGMVKIIKNGSTLATPFLDLRSRVNDYWDHGLIGMAVDPNFATNGYVYLSYTYENNANDYSGTKTGRVSRFTASGDASSLATEQVILGTSVGASCQAFAAGADCIPSDDTSHSVGQLRFDSSGNLFASFGDGASFNVVDDLALRAQDVASLGGKIVRVTPLGAGLSTNPFWTGNASANASKIWATGVRNSFRFGLRGGVYPYAGDVGWDGWDEINAAVRAANLGWPCYEGSARQAGYESKPVCQTLYGRGATAVKNGTLVMDHFYAGQHVSTAAVGGTFYTATAFPTKYQGAFFYADYGQSIIRYFTADANDNLTSGPFDFVFGADGPIQVEQGADGSLYYLAIITGELRKIVYSGPDTTAPAIASTTPASGETGVGLATTVSGVFSELVDPNTVPGNVTLAQQSNGQPVAGSVVYNGNSRSAILTPAIQLSAGTTYIARVKGGSAGVKDLAGNALATDFTWTFTTFNPQPPPTGTTDVSALNWTAMVNGWGPAEKNMSNGEQAPGDGRTMSIRGAQFPKGLGAHAPSDIHFFIGNACSSLTATIGIDDEAAPNGSVIFQVFGDGTKLYESGVLTGSSAAQNISVNIAGKNDLELTVTDAGNGNAFDHADWANARLTCGSAPPTAISGVQATAITSSGATINWTTNNLADSQVDYGVTTAYGSSTSLNSAMVTSHSTALTGLAAATVYHYRVKSRDAGGVLVTSPDNTFTTSAAGATVTFLSDMTWTSMTNGWGPVEKDMSNGEQAAGDGRTLTIRGATYPKGLGAHAASNIKYNIDGAGCRTFVADVGVDDETGGNGSVVFQVFADAAKLYDSGVVRGTTPVKAVSVDITGKKQLELAVLDSGDGAAYDHADWAGARLLCGGSTPPTVTVASPLPTLTYKVGDVINYSGSARDANNTPIPAAGLTWQIIIHHCPGGNCHTHPFANSTGPTGSFTIPDHGDESYFELSLTAVDSAGISSTASVSIQPQTVQLTLATSPAGLQVVYGGTAYAAPVTITTIVGSTHTVQAPSPQGTNTFTSWSDGGAQQHNINIGASNLTLTATFSGSSPAFSVSSTSPAGGATGVPVNTAVSATFSKAINPATLTSQTMTLVASGSSTPVPGAVAYDAANLKGTLTPSAALQPGVAYTATVKGGAGGVKDTAGNALAADTVWTFTTAAATTTAAQYLSDQTWTSMTNGWGAAERDMSNGEMASGDGRAITIRGVPYAKGLGVHAPSNIAFSIPAGCSAFKAVVGIDDEVAPNGSVIFRVLLDGATAYDSGVVNGATAGKDVNLSVSGKTRIELVLTDGGDGAGFDHADWADAQLSCTPARPPAGTPYVSDLTPTFAVNGWGPFEKDRSNGEQAAGDGRTITVQGVTYAKGLGAHATSDIRYNLGGACTTFTATVGIDAEVAPAGSVVFQVWADGAKLFDSGVMTASTAAKTVNVNLSGKTSVRLAITDGGNGNASDHGDWADARLVCP